MKKIFVFTLIFMLAGLSGFGQYSTPGTGVSWTMNDLVTNSEGVVTAAGQDFLVHDDFIISFLDTIRIVENTTILFEAEVLITVMGILDVDPPDSVLFTAIDSLFTYKSFRFEDTDFSVMKKSRVEFGGGIDLVDSDVMFENCIFRRNDKSNTTGVVDLFFSNAHIINCEFYDNQGPAVLSGANSQSSPLISGNIIRRNNTMNTNMPQINLGTSSPGVPIQIIGNTIEGLYDKAGGIAVTTLAGGDLECVIDSNQIYNNRYGITAYGYNISSIISNNVILDNNIEGLPMQGGSGINFWGGTSNTSMVFGNEISGNLWGVTVTGEALPNFGQVDPDTINSGENKFYNNGNLGIQYALYNNTPNDIYAENNFWGSYDLDSVEQVIFHQPDDETLGFVDYLPILDSLPTRVLGIQVPEQITLFPNPAENHIHIQRPAAFKNENNLSCHIYNTGGQLAASFTFTGKDLKIDLSDLITGVYFVEISGRKLSFTSRFIKR